MNRSLTRKRATGTGRGLRKIKEKYQAGERENERGLRKQREDCVSRGRAEEGYQDGRNWATGTEGGGVVMGEGLRRNIIPGGEGKRRSPRGNWQGT